MKVIIIGAGIGGLCLAQGLKKVGIPFIIFERNADRDAWLEGYRLNINPIGSRALYQCLPQNLWNAFLAGVSDAKDGFGFLSEDLTLLLKVENQLLSGGLTEPHKIHHAIGRTLLRKILMQGVTQDVVFGKTFQRYEHRADGKVTVYFEDGTTDKGDLVIGADGANSNVRSQLLPNARRVETEAIAVAGRTLLDHNREWIPELFQSRMNVLMPLDKFFLFSAPFDHAVKTSSQRHHIETIAKHAGLDNNAFFDKQEDYILWSFVANRKEFQHIRGDLQEIVAKKIQHWHPQFKKLILAADSKTVNAINLKTMARVKPWRSTNVTLLGDAIHNMTPLYGMGANMALHDAAVLTNRLTEAHAKGKDLIAAIREYEQIMLKRGFEAVDKAREFTERAINENKFQRTMVRKWFMLCRKFPSLKRVGFRDNWWEIE
jgi:salicylate hydroxylase